MERTAAGNMSLAPIPNPRKPIEVYCLEGIDLVVELNFTDDPILPSSRETTGSLVPDLNLPAASEEGESEVLTPEKPAEGLILSGEGEKKKAATAKALETGACKQKRKKRENHPPPIRSSKRAAVKKRVAKGQYY